MADLAFFNLSAPMKLAEIAALSGCTLHNANDGNKLITGVAPLESAGSSDITFLSNPKYAAALENSAAGSCILAEKHIAKAPAGMALLISSNPYASYAKIATAFYPEDTTEQNIAPSAVVEKSAQIGKNTSIGPGVYIGRGVKIGDNCVIKHGATITHSIIGNNVIIHPGVRIGQDGFGFATERGVHLKVPQLGRVIIEDHVEIGANSCIDRGAGPDTIIGQGSKIDNLVQIGHNVQIGKGCIIVAQVGIAGSTKLGDYVVLGGQVGVAGHLNIGSMVNVAAQSGIGQDVEAKVVIGGCPAVPIRQWHRQNFALQKLIKQNNDKQD